MKRYRVQQEKIYSGGIPPKGAGTYSPPARYRVTSNPEAKAGTAGATENLEKQSPAARIKRA